MRLLSSTGKKLSFDNKSVEYIEPVPEGCVCLDYFKPGYRFGVQMEGNDVPVEYFTSDNVDNLNYFNYTSKFSTGFPVGRFSGLASDAYFKYDLSNVITDDEFTIEYLLKYDGNSSSFGICSYIEANDESYFGNFYHYNGNYDRCDTNHRHPGGSYPWESHTVDGTPIGKDLHCNSWFHFAVSKSKTGFLYFINGRLIRGWNSSSMKMTTSNLKLWFCPCVVDTNNWSNKYYNYCLTQVAVYNYSKYTNNFIVSNDLIIR